jgi:hypothetical protein
MYEGSEDDDGFEGYVPSTVDPGPILLVTVIVIIVLLLVALPFVIVLMEKYDEQMLASGGMDCQEGQGERSPVLQGTPPNNRMEEDHSFLSCDGSSCSDENKVHEKDDGASLDVPVGGERCSGSSGDQLEQGNEGDGIDGAMQVKVEDVEQLHKPRIDRSLCLSTKGFLDEMAAIMAWDVEMKRIIKLSLPL